MKLPSKVGQAAEKRVARMLGGRLRPASGARWYAKGDVATKTRLAQVKSTATARKQFSLKLTDLLAVEKQAIAENREPEFIVEFETPGTRYHYRIERIFPS